MCSGVTSQHCNFVQEFLKRTLERILSMMFCYKSKKKDYIAAHVLLLVGNLWDWLVWWADLQRYIFSGCLVASFSCAFIIHLRTSMIEQQVWALLYWPYERCNARFIHTPFSSLSFPFTVCSRKTYTIPYHSAILFLFSSLSLDHVDISRIFD